MSICKGCKAEIIWVVAVTKKGTKHHPCDPELYDIQDDLAQGELLVLNPDTNKFGKLKNQTKGYISHYATCPVADNFRKNNIKK